MLKNRSFLIINRPFNGYSLINRTNLKFFIRILIGLILTHILSHQFQSIHATPNHKANWKYRLQKTTISNG